MGKIILDGMEFRARIGVQENERMYGNRIIAKVIIESPAINGITDKLEDTLDYGEVYQVVKNVLTNPANLLEHAAHNIMEELKGKFNHKMHSLSVELKKMPPPLNGIVKYSAVTLYWELGMP